MGTIIRTSSLITRGAHSTVDLAARAAEACIAKTDIDRNDIGIFIYAGVYRDDNLIEPAVATIIQKKIGLNTDPVGKGSLDNLTFSFDLINGPCGFLSAVCVAQAALMCGSARNALIATAVAHPSKRHDADFPFASAGAAVLLSQTGDADRGFMDFLFKTSGDGRVGYTASADANRFGTRGRETVHIDMDEDYQQKLIEFTSESIREFITSHKIKIEDIDVLVANQQFRNFGRTVADSAGINGRAQVIDLFDEYGDIHASSLINGYAFASEQGLLKKGGKALFIASGAGLSAACALYVA